MNDDPKKPNLPADDQFDPGFEDDLDIDMDIDVEGNDEFPAEDWDENFDEGTEATPTPVKKRGLPRGKMLWVIIGIVVLAIGWTVFGGKKESALPEGGESAMPVASDVPSMQVGELENNNDMPPMPAPMNAEGEAPPAEAQAADVAVIEDPLLEVPKVPAVPADRRLSEVDVTVPAASTQPIPVQPDTAGAPVADNSAALIAEKEKEMADKLAALEKSWQERFSAMESDLKQKVDAAETKLKGTEKIVETRPDNSAELKSLKDQNAGLKTEIESLKAEKKKAEEATKTAKADAKRAQEEVAAVKAAPPVQATAPLQKAEDLWVLRSAQPDKALISQKGSEVMQSIKAGDNVPGLGTVISVKMEGKAWVVKGTDGSLSR